MEKERANKKSKRTARRMKVRHKIKLLNGWYLPKRKSYSRRPWKYVNPIKRGTLKKKRTREAIVESMDGRGSPFYLKRRLQKLRRQQKYLIKKNLYPNKERYLPVRKTQNRVNWLWHFCDVKFSEEYIPIRYRYQWFIKRSGFWSDRGRITTDNKNKNYQPLKLLELWKKQEPLECFIHDCKLEKCTSQSGWDYVKCPMSDCFIFMGLSKIHNYLKNVQDQTQAGYKWDKEKLKCFCSEPLVLCEWRSEHNPGRIYFKCPGNRCFLLVGMRGAQWYKHSMDEQHRVLRNTVRHAYSYHRVFLEKYVVGSNRNLS